MTTQEDFCLSISGFIATTSLSKNEKAPPKERVRRLMQLYSLFRRRGTLGSKTYYENNNNIVLNIMSTPRRFLPAIAK
ncbi:hypothetical protein [uncultured Pyramidobacter sp.]|nr:hypothetical protein [uncultured Pyramidobacter sp.]